MQLLKDRILTDGVVKEGNILKVDSFLNHQMDIDLINEVGKEFKKRFDHCPITKILTIEASGIGIACIAAQYFHVPVVFAKKAQSVNLDGEMYTTKVESFTHKKVYDVILSKKFLGPEDHVLPARYRIKLRSRTRISDGSYCLATRFSSLSKTTLGCSLSQS